MIETDQRGDKRWDSCSLQQPLRWEEGGENKGMVMEGGGGEHLAEGRKRSEMVGKRAEVGGEDRGKRILWRRIC